MKKLILIFIALLLASSILPGCKPVVGFEHWHLFGNDEMPNASKEVVAEPLCENLSAQKSKGIKNVVIFGDSLSDTNTLKGRRLQMNPEKPFFLGRFSNGPVWNDYLADCVKLGVENYSQGGAMTKSSVMVPSDELLSYIRELGRSLAIGSVDQFVDDYLKEHNGIIENPDKTLFIIWAGANDYLSKFDNSDDLTTMIDLPDTPYKGGNAIAKISAENIGDDIHKLYDAGARTIVVANMPDIGVTPSIKSNKSYLPDGLSNDARHYRLSEELSRITTLHNKLLAQKIYEISSNLDDSTLKIAIFDSAEALKNLMNNKGPHGENNFDYGIDLEKSFTKLSVPGKKPIRIGQKCYTGGYFGSDDQKKICPDVAKMFFWDEIHPTTAGHCGIAFLLHNFLNDENIIEQKAQFEEYKKLCTHSPNQSP